MLLFNAENRLGCLARPVFSFAKDPKRPPSRFEARAGDVIDWVCGKMFIIMSKRTRNRANTFRLTILFALALMGVIGFAQKADADITTGLVGYWNFEEGTGSSAADSSGNGNAGTLTNGPSWVAGKIGNNALNFNTDHDDRVAIGDPAVLRNLGSSSPMTVALWIKPTEYTVSSMAMVSKINVSTLGWSFALAPGAQDGFQFTADFSTTDITARSVDGSAQYGVWQHVVMTWDGSTSASNIHIYVNGTETPTYDLQTNAAGTRVSDSGFNFNIGNITGGTRSVEGSMDDVRVYNRALSSSDVAELYAFTSSDATAPTITNISSDKANGTYGIGETIDVDVTFSEPVTSTGNVTVTLETGATDRTCTFTVSNSTTGTCNYVVQSGDTSSDLTVASVSGTISDAASNAMTDFVPATNLAANKAIVIDTNPVDTTAPTITNVSSDKPNGSYKAGEVIDVDVTFSEAVTSTGNVTVTLETGTVDRTCSFTVSNSTTGTCNYTVQAGDTTSDLTVSSITGTIADGASNAMTNFVPATNLAANKALVIDTANPTISSIASSTTANSATITWTTNEPATSTIRYGLSASYGTATSSDMATTTHSYALSGLAASSTYHFQISIADAAGNIATSSDQTFTTGSVDITTGLVALWNLEEGTGTTAIDSISANNGTLTNGPTWIPGQIGNYALSFDGTNDFVSTTDVAAAESIGAITVSAWAKSSTTDLVGAQYIFAKSRSGQTNISWEIAKSAQEKFTFAVSNGTTKSTATTDLAFADTSWHHIVGVYDGSLVRIYVDGAEADATPAALTGNVSNTAYYICLGTYSSAGNCSGSGYFAGSIDDPRVYNRALSAADISLLYDYRGIDVTPPTISAIASSTGPTSATINWTTDEAATSTVRYGLTSGYGSASTSASLVTTRSIVLTGLTPSTVYHYQVSSSDPSGNLATSSDLTFTTAAVDTTAPTVSSVVSNPSSATAVITWTTNEPASSQVEYGLTSSYTSSTTLSPTATTSHSVVITGLTASTTYHFRVRSVDSSGNVGSSTDATFRTIGGVSLCSAVGDCITLQDGMTWVFFGDSITNAHGYSDYMETYFHLRYPELDLHFRGIGRGGATIPEGTTGGRYDKLVYALSPDVVSEMFGHNGSATATEFRDQLYDLADNYIVAKNNATPVMFGPHPTNTSTGKPVLLSYSTELVGVAQARDYVYANIWQYLLDIWAPNLASGSPVSLQEANAIHPGPSGHLGIAYALLSKMNAEGDVSSATINATNATLLAQSHATISNIATTSDGIDFTRLDDRLPMAWDDEAREIIRLMPQVLDMNRYMLTVNGLSSGTYEVYVDGVLSGTTTASKLATGWNMSEMTQGPIHNQLLEVLGRVRDKEGMKREAIADGVIDTAHGDYADDIITRDTAGTGAGIGVSRYKSNADAAYDSGLRGDDLKASVQPALTEINNLDNLIYAAKQPVSRNFSLKYIAGSGTADAGAPTVSVTAPSNNATTSGTSVTVSANATDDIGVVGVNFYLDGSIDLHPEVLFTPPYSISWNSTTVADGAHTVVAVARDAAGNVATSSSITIIIDNTAPVRSSGSPTGTLALNTSSTTISLTTNEAATCRYSTNAGIAYGSMTNLSTTGGVSHSQVVNGLSNGGNYIYYVKCQDARGNANASDFTISFSVAGDTTFPVVAMTAPANNAVISGSSVTLSATASDDVSVAGVKFLLDDSILIGSEDTSSPYSISWDSTSVADGIHTLKAVARDGSNNVTDSSFITINVDNAAPARSGGVPSGTLQLYTTSALLQVTTDESATCKYSATPGIGYGSMTSFTTTGGQNHSASVTGLTNGEAYAYYVKCRDAQSNTNATDYQISFSVAADESTPSVVVTSPTNNQIVSGSVSMIADASDDVAVAGVRFRLDGVDIGPEDISSPYTYLWNTSSASEGSHVVSAVARDTTGNEAVASNVNVIVGNSAPVISSISSGSPSSSGTTISWTTSEAADSLVQYGLDTTYSNSSSLNSSPVTSHSVTLSGLSSGALYHYRVISKDTSNAGATSTDGTFTTAVAAVESTGGGATGGGGSGGGSGLVIIYNNQAAQGLSDRCSPGQNFDTVTGQRCSTASGPALGSTVGTGLPNAGTGGLGGGSFVSNLTIGNTNQEVHLLQRFLNANGFRIAQSGAGSPGNETAYFGPATRAALAKFQAANGISPASGYFGAITRNAINRMSGSGAQAPQVISPANLNANESQPSIATAPASAGASLSLGSSGAAVKSLRIKLRSLGYFAPYGSASDVPAGPSSETEFFGATTESAVKKYQCDKSIVCSGAAATTGWGLVGPKTRASLGL